MTTSAISKNFALNGAHTAGIFADMTVDGPEIGTLVCVVDRAKNLPNRKTIGKQDPYCAARLGKEAKKTSTDIRGGQTPRWDQELRFTVHDTADYYQLKVSVFTDDKKTDLIGETWVDLKTIITSGGGQCDFWKTLTCRGKYAGDIRLEITYYDTRPKPDKSPTRQFKPPSPDYQEMSPVRRKDVIKRRPVSSADPAALEPASTMSAAIPAARPPLPSEYSTSSSSSSSRGGRQSLGAVGGPRELRQTRRDAYENPRHSEERDLSHRALAPVSHHDYYPDPRGGGDHASYASDREEPRGQHHQGGHPPPPPPAHRARGDQDVPPRSSFEGAPPHKAIHPAAARHELLKSEAQRKASPSYPGRPKFKGTIPPAHPPAPLQRAITYDPYMMAGDAYGAYDPPRSMQPTVEDYPESEAGSYGPNYRHGGPRALPDEMAYARGGALPDDMAYARGGYDRGRPVGVPAAPMSRSPGASAGYLSQSPGRIPPSGGGYSRESHRYTNSMPHVGHRGYDDEAPAQMPYHGHGHGHDHGHGHGHAHAYAHGHGHPGQGRRHSPPYDRRATHHPNSSSHSLHEMPPSLVPGADPNLAQEVAHRLYDDRRHGERYYGGPPVSRDGQRSDPPDYDVHPDNDMQGSFSQAGAAQRYDRDRRSDVDLYNGSEHQAPRHRNVSPNPARSPNHAIRRKSVSPGPRISESRRLSDVPYGPDSYDTYNPGASRDGTPGLDYDSPSKIVMHDGTEVDPSDHLPMESWAPEPEQKSPQAPTPTAESRARPALTGGPPTNGRRQLRVRAQSNATPSHSSEDLRLIHGGGGGGGGGAPPPAARGRLQKKADRAPMPMPAHPLSGLDANASLSSDDLMHDRQSQYSHSRSPRASAWDYPSDGYTPKNQGQSPSHGGAHGPPIPAKMALPITAGGAELALMEEMQKIDIGTGRSRRRGGY